MTTPRMRAARTVTALVTASMLVAACSSAAPSPPPSAAPTPRPTPNPHLPSPATVQQVFTGLGKAGLRITANTATLGDEGGDVVRKVYATYVGWPLDVTEFRSATVLTKRLNWPDGETPGKGEPPIALAGINILITWGPAKAGTKPGALSEGQVDALVELVDAADLLLSPLKTRTSVPVELAAPPGPAASTAPSPAAS